MALSFTGTFGTLSANGNAPAVPVSPANETIVLSVHAPTGSSLTVKVKISYAVTEPAWASAQSGSNDWQYQGMKDRDSDAVVAGSTGIVISAETHRHFILNTNNVSFFTVEVSGFVSGSVVVNTQFMIPD